MTHRRCSEARALYLLSCAEIDAGGGVYRYSLSPDGQLSEAAYLPCEKPMYAVMGGGRLHVLLRSPFSENENSGYFSCQPDFSDRSAVQDTLGKCACHLAVDTDVFITNYLSGNLSRNCRDIVTHRGSGVSLPRQDMPHTHFACFSPDRAFVLCCDLGLDTVYIYDRALNEISSASVPPGYGVRHLVFSEDGKFFYAVNELVPSVSVFSFSNGTATLLSTFPLNCRMSGSTAAAIRRDPTSGLLYVSVRGEDKVFVLRAEGAILKTMCSFAAGGCSPRDFLPVGAFLVVTNEASDRVSVLAKTDGMPVSTVQLKNPLCVLEATPDDEF